MLLTILLAGGIALLIFKLWFPSPFQEMSGGQRLFWLVVGVDVALGPALTLIVSSRQKRRSESRNDLAMIIALQCAALAYGIVTVYLARPIHLVFEVDRFVVVTASEIDRHELLRAPAELQRSSLSGPTLIAAERPSGKEMLESLDESFQGRDLARQPRFWRPYSTARTEALNRAVPFKKFALDHPDRRAVLENAARDVSVDVSKTRVLPVVSRMASWVALIDDLGQPVGFAPVEAF